jgi:hypothetical protein
LAHGHVNAILEAGGVNVGKTLDDEGRRFVGDVEQDAIGPAPLHFAINRTGHDVAGGEGFEGMIGIHELMAGAVLQDGAFAAHRLADEE